MNTIVEPEKKIPVIDDVDLIIVGGGPAGVAASVTASEMGLSTIIIEKNGFFGGANVAGYSATIGGLFNSTKDGEPFQIVNGFASRFADLLEERGGLVRTERFGHTWLSPHDPLVWKEVADKLIKDAKVKTYFHTLFVDSVVHDGNIDYVIIENKDGRSAIKAKYFIDASGDGDLAVKSGASYKFGEDGNIQSMTMTFRMQNVSWEKYGNFTLEDVWQKVTEALKTGNYYLPRTHPFIFRAPNKSHAILNATSIVASDNRTLYPTKTDDKTEAEFLGREQIREYERFVRDYIPGFENATIMDTASEIGIRQSRSIDCAYTLKNDDVIKARKFPTSIARSAWPIEIHLGAEGVKIVNLDDDYYEIPYEVMIVNNVKNLLVVGRCISAEHEALASCRVVAQCMEEGLASAVAVYIANQDSVLLKNIEIKKLQEIMREKGANI